MNDEREDLVGLDWWPISHEHFNEASAIVKRLDLTPSELSALVTWASVPSYAVKSPMIDTERGSRNVRLIDYDKLYRALKARAAQ